MLVFQVLCNVVDVCCLLVVTSAFVISVRYEVASMRQGYDIARTHRKDRKDSAVEHTDIEKDIFLHLKPSY